MEKLNRAARRAEMRAHGITTRDLRMVAQWERRRAERTVREIRKFLIPALTLEQKVQMLAAKWGRARP
jgi:ribosomal protein L31E